MEPEIVNLDMPPHLLNVHTHKQTQHTDAAELAPDAGTCCFGDERSTLFSREGELETCVYICLPVLVLSGIRRKQENTGREGENRPLKMVRGR